MPKDPHRFVPWYDLVYLFLTSVPSRLLASDLATVLSCYHASLAGTLARLRYAGTSPSLKQVHICAFIAQIVVA